jgi:hypothetical protein
MNIESLAREAAYALSRTRNWRSRASLLAATARFHLNNKFGPVVPSLPQIDVDIMLGSTPFTVRLRQHTGDIFIFYEVLAFGAYALPTEIVPEGIRTIVDCGANIGMTSLYFSQRYPNSRIFAIEPEPTNFKLLKQNTAAVDRIVPLEAAIVGTSRKQVQFADRQVVS